ncbi:MAG: UDP-GlkcNAc C4 epimerase WbpP [Cyclobacteriaceae bacterium]|nr:MAG: UDP-GlkcNAc C4 epimerase WbpP [Cyclobacteriaceae bacterium]
MSEFHKLQNELKENSSTWLVTGVAGFIGSHLLEQLLKLGQKVVGLDNFSTGNRNNLTLVQQAVSSEQWDGFEFLEGDIQEFSTCQQVVKNVDYVLHQAALGSVPRSLETPLITNASNITGFLNMLEASRQAKVKRFVYAASSSTYGDHPGLPKVEEAIGNPLSPYAVTKYVNELYASVFGKCYQVQSVGLRYFNVFGPRQDPNGAYAAVIPKWIGSLISGEQVYINGDGETSRDFCYVANAVQANLLAATQPIKTISPVYNVAVGDQTTLNQLFEKIKARLATYNNVMSEAKVAYQDFRDGDVRHSLADISKIGTQLGYHPEFRINQGLDQTVAWFWKSAT